MPKQTFHLRSPEGPMVFLGSREIAPFSDLGAGARPNHGYAFFCPYCASVWGQTMVEGSPYCQPVNAACITHAQFPTDGTFSRQYSEPSDPRSDIDLPEAVLRHDVLALTTFYLNHPQALKLIRYVN